MKILTTADYCRDLILLSEIFGHNKQLSNVPGIYCIINSVNSKSYIGSSKNIYKRLRDHIYRLRRGSHYNEYLQRAFIKYGERNFYFSVIEECLESLLEDREQFYMDTLNSVNPFFGYNIAPTANRSVISEETKKKISESMIGKPGRRLGFKVTETTKEKLREINTGKVTSPGTKSKISNTLKGVNTWARGSIKGPRPPEVKEKISAKNKGASNGQAKPVLFVVDGIIVGRWLSALDAAVANSLKPYTLRIYARNKKMYNGGHFEYE